MATKNEIEQLRLDVCEHLLQEIKSRSDIHTADSETVLNLAEAFAWIRYPNQSHGGGSKPSNS